jgi:hypothetical protein
MRDGTDLHQDRRCPREESGVAQQEDDDHVELRVHGVAGGTPASLLQLAPQQVPHPAEEGDAEITEWRQPDPPPHLRAWSWGSLTSGRWYHAFYLLLLPFMLANLAGWMVVTEPGEGERARPVRFRATVLAVRTVGLAVTVLFVLWAQLVVADLAAYQYLVRRAGQPAWWVGVGTAATAMVLLLVAALTRLRPRRAWRSSGIHTLAWNVWTDPVGDAALHHHQHPMWNSPGINVGLRRLHVGGGLAVIALVATWDPWTLREPWQSMAVVAFGLGVAGLVVVLGLLAWISLSDGRPRGGYPDRADCECFPDGKRPCTPATGRGLPPRALVRWGGWLLPAAAVALAALSAMGLQWSATNGPAVLPAVRGAGLWVAVAILAGSVLVAVGAGWRSGRPAQRANAPGLLLLAAAVGALLGAGLAEQVARLLGGGCADEACLLVGEHVDWLAVAIVGILAVVLTVVAAVAAIRLRAERAAQRRGAAEPPAGLASITKQASWLMVLVGGLGAVTATGGVALILTWQGLRPVETTVPAVVEWVVVLALGVAAAVAGAMWLMRVRWPRWGRIVGGVVLAVVVGSIVVPVLTEADPSWSLQVLGVPVPPTTFPQFALAVAVVLPTAILLRRIVAGLTNAEVRRGVGVLWDVGTFWPRWFHPFAPPTYSDRAVTSMVRRIEDHARSSPDPLLVAAHSQGGVIAGTAVLGTARYADLRSIGLLTFGSPWRRLYAEFFPAYFSIRTDKALYDRLAGRWRNLFRATDPIGGPVGCAGVDVPTLEGLGRRHSDYWLEGEYATAATELLDLTAAPCTVASSG